MVIDDVYTTGSTMDVIAQLLREKEQKVFFFLTVCIEVTGKKILFMVMDI